MSPIIEHQWTAPSGLPAYVTLNRYGYRCGYIDVSRLPLFSLVTDSYFIELEIDDKLYSLCPPLLTMHEAFNEISVHGGVTFNGPYTNLSSQLIGFDCAHPGDKPDIKAAEQQGIDTNHIFDWRNEPGAVVRTLDYCIGQCESLADQLNTINSKFNYIITDYPELII